MDGLVSCGGLGSSLSVSCQLLVELSYHVISDLNADNHWCRKHDRLCACPIAPMTYSVLVETLNDARSISLCECQWDGLHSLVITP